MAKTNRAKKVSRAMAKYTLEWRPNYTFRSKDGRMVVLRARTARDTLPMVGNR